MVNPSSYCARSRRNKGFSSVKLIMPGYGVISHGLRGPWVEKFDCRYQMPKCGD